jgi:hypothetical protein
MAHLIHQLSLAVGGLVVLLAGWLLVERFARPPAGTPWEQAHPIACGACGRGCACGSEVARSTPVLEPPGSATRMQTLRSE